MLFPQICQPQQSIPKIYSSIDCPKVCFHFNISFLGSVDNYERQRQATIKCKYINGNTKRLLKITLIVGTHQNKQDPENKEAQIITSILINNISRKRQMRRLRGECDFKNQLLKSFSHELRTPLSCSIQLLAAAKEQIDDRSSSLYLILQQALLQNSLLSYQIADILDFAALESQNFQYNIREFNLEDTIEELKSLYQEACQEKRINLRFQNEIHFAIKTDQQRLNQVLVNLLNNSIKFTPQFGSIEVIFEQRGQSMVDCTVVDTGFGMTEKQVNQQMMAFKKKRCLISTDETAGRKKAGLGLILSYRLIKGLAVSYENELKIQSKKNEGTKINFMIESLTAQPSEYIQLTDKVGTTNLVELKSQSYTQWQMTDRQLSLKGEPRFQIPKLPRVSIGSYDRKESKREVTTQGLSQCEDKETKCSCNNILIVDDVPFNHIALRSLLKCFNLSCDQAYDGQNALEMVKKKQEDHCPYYKIIFMDIEMPGMNGFETTFHILHYLQEFKYLTNIIMCSAYDTAENTNQAMISGIKDILPKPVHKSSLRAILHKYYQIH